MKNAIKYVNLLENGTTTSYKVEETKGRKTFAIELTGIKVCTLNKELREVTIENNYGLKLNKFEDMADRLMKHITNSDGLAYKLGMWKENKLVYLVTWTDISPITVNDKNPKRLHLSNEIGNSLDYVGGGMYD